MANEVVPRKEVRRGGWKKRREEEVEGERREGTGERIGEGEGRGGGGEGVGETELAYSSDSMVQLVTL